MFHFLLVANISEKVCFKKLPHYSIEFFCFLISPSAVLPKDVALNELTWLIQSTCGNGKFLHVKGCL